MSEKTMMPEMAAFEVRESSRPTWPEYFMAITRLVARRSTCLRRSVGAIVVKEKRILATGYNGAPAGLKHCREVGCLRENASIPSGERHELCRGLHAEQNALLFAARSGEDMQGAVLYCTNQPCVVCAKMIIQSGIKMIIYKGDYPDKLSLDMFEEAEIEIKKVK